MIVPLTPDKLKNWLIHHPTPCLFLDIDGTLALFQLNPADSRIPVSTLKLIKKLQYLDVPVAIITGRSLVEARHMLILENLPLTLPIGATHGLEIAFSSDSTPVVADFIQAELPLIIDKINIQCEQMHLTNFLLEKKPYSVALHYRQNPDLAQNVKNLMQKVVQNFPNWQCKQGKFVWEIMPMGFDKGQAVTAILAYFQQSHKRQYCPIFIGDDISDEAGFLAVQAKNGMGIKVGEPIDIPSHANFFVHNINEVSHILQSILQHYQPHTSQNEPTL